MTFSFAEDSGAQPRIFLRIQDRGGDAPNAACGCEGDAPVRKVLWCDERPQKDTTLRTKAALYCIHLSSIHLESTCIHSLPFACWPRLPTVRSFIPSISKSRLS